MARSARAPHRRTVLTALADAKRRLSVLRSRWVVADAVYDTSVHDTHGNSQLRDRRDDEYPENRAAEWAHLLVELDETIEALVAARTQAHAEYRRLRYPTA